MIFVSIKQQVCQKQIKNIDSCQRFLIQQVYFLNTEYRGDKI